MVRGSVESMAGANVDKALDRLAGYRFRASFTLRDAERTTARRHGPAVIEQHARDLLAARLFTARPSNDGRQTPWGGHPVFRAQHATATCCRGCLERLHGIAKGHELTREEQDHVVSVILTWITRQLATAAGERGPERRPA